jgi:hypothetical protein
MIGSQIANMSWFDDFSKYISFLQDFVNFKGFLRKKGGKIAKRRAKAPMLTKVSLF